MAVLPKAVGYIYRGRDNIHIYIYPTAFGKPATVPSPGCVYSHVLGVCVCVCVCVCVSSCAASMQRCIISSMHESIQRMSRLILRFISVSNASDVVVLLSSASIFQFCCAVVLLISGLILVSCCWFWGQFSRHFCVRGRLLATLRLPGLPREGQR